MPHPGKVCRLVPRALIAALLCLVSGLAGYGLAVLAHRPEEPAPAPGERAARGDRALELAEVRRVTLRVSADSGAEAQLAEAEALLRNRLAAAGLAVVAPDEPFDAVVIARLESHHFRAFDVHGVAAELHLEGLHEVRIKGLPRLIPHDIWQAYTTRLVQPDTLPRESVQALDELVVHLVGAFQRARGGQR